jgi:hypothetical protein
LFYITYFFLKTRISTSTLPACEKIIKKRGGGRDKMKEKEKKRQYLKKRNKKDNKKIPLS